MRGLDLFSFEDEDQTHYVVKFELKYLKNAGLKVGLDYCRKIKNCIYLKRSGTRYSILVCMKVDMLKFP